MVITTRNELAKAMIDNIAEMEITDEAYQAYKNEKRYFRYFLFCAIMAGLMFSLAFLFRKDVILFRIVSISGVILFMIPASILGRGRWESLDATCRVLVFGWHRYRISKESSGRATIVLKKPAQKTTDC